MVQTRADSQAAGHPPQAPSPRNPSSARPVPHQTRAGVGSYYSSAKRTIRRSRSNALWPMPSTAARLLSRERRRSLRGRAGHQPRCAAIRRYGCTSVEYQVADYFATPILARPSSSASAGEAVAVMVGEVPECTSVPHQDQTVHHCAEICRRRQRHRYLMASNLSWRTVDIAPQAYTLRWLVEVFVQDSELHSKAGAP